MYVRLNVSQMIHMNGWMDGWMNDIHPSIHPSIHMNHLNECINLTFGGICNEFHYMFNAESSGERILKIGQNLQSYGQE